MVRLIASNPRGLGLNPGPDVICRLSLLLVLVFAQRGFLQISSLPPSTKTKFAVINKVGATHSSRHFFWSQGCPLTRGSSVLLTIKQFTFVAHQ